MKSIKLKTVLYQKFLKSRNKDDLDTFRKHRNKTNSLLRKTKKEYFENLFSPDMKPTPEII